MLLAMRMEEACNYMYVIGQFNFKIDVSQNIFKKVCKGKYSTLLCK